MFITCSYGTLKIEQNHIIIITFLFGLFILLLKIHGFTSNGHTESENSRGPTLAILLIVL